MRAPVMAPIALLIAGLIAGCAAYAPPALPGAPQGAELVRDVPIQCPDGSLLYFHLYDLNPATEAAFVVVGPTDSRHKHGDPFMAIQVDDAGVPVFYLLTPSGIKTLTAAEWTARYGGTSGNSACFAYAKRQV